MTEEIINGIDVSGCCLYKNGICLTDKGKCTSMCDYGAYAREEKLKRLEQRLIAAEQSEQEATEIIAELKKDLDLFRKAHDNEQAQRRILEQKLEKIKELCQVPNEPYYNSECEFGKGRIDLGQEILEIIEGAEDE